jgi:CxxC-x17-CxxC domain-containing protein
MPKFNRDSRGGGFGGGFNNRGGGAGGRPSFPRKSFGGAGGDRGPVTMHDATCDECKRPCQVPFRPTGDRPIYCKNCFDKRGGGREAGRFAGAAGNVNPDGFSQNDIKTQLAMINIKLDKVMKALDLAPKSTPPPVIKSAVVSEEAKEVVADSSKKVLKSKKAKK